MANPSQALVSRVTPGEFKGYIVDTLYFSSPTELMQFSLETAPAEVNHPRGAWYGLENQSLESFFNLGYSTAALSLFSQESAKIQAKHTLSSRLSPAPCGGAWIIPLVLQSHPLASRIHPREKLAPLNIKLRIGASASTDAALITQSVIKVARALWDYQLAGGIVSLSVIHAHGYHILRESSFEGLYIETQIPLTSEADISLACSTPLYRICAIGLMLSLSPLTGDSLRGWYSPEPELLTLRGTDQDQAELTRFGITA